MCIYIYIERERGSKGFYNIIHGIVSSPTQINQLSLLLPIFDLQYSKLVRWIDPRQVKIGPWQKGTSHKCIQMSEPENSWV